MENNINNIDKGLNWLEKLLELAKKYRWKEWLEIFIVLFTFGTMILVFSQPAKILDFFNNVAQEKHTELMEARRENNSEIQRKADRLLYRWNAERAVLVELHNGQNSISAGIPFLRASATFEALNDNIFPVATQYQAVTLSLIPFANHLYQKGYWTGYTKEIKDIDKSLCYRMLANNAEYFSAVVIQGITQPIGFLFLSFDDENIPSESQLAELREEMERTALEVAVLLEVRNR